jgi:hypothetical protein
MTRDVAQVVEPLSSKEPWVKPLILPKKKAYLWKACTFVIYNCTSSTVNVEHKGESFLLFC